MKKIHWILTGLSFTIVLLSVNRLTDLTSGYMQPFEFLRWLDFNAMLPIPLFSVILYFLLMSEVIYDAPFRKSARFTLLSIIFIAGVYLLGAGSGTHEVTNYLNARFCDAGEVTTTLCNIIAYNDDTFSHYVYFVGFLLLNMVLILLEYAMPRKAAVTRRDFFFITWNALVIALGIFANLAFEEIGLDLYIVGALMLLTHWILVWGGKPMTSLPITFYFAVAFTLSVIGTVFYRINS